MRTTVTWGNCSIRPEAAVVPGTSHGAKPSLLGFPTPTSNCSVFQPWSKRVSAISRTAVYGPVRTVVWEGRSRKAPPYPDPWHFSDMAVRQTMSVFGVERTSHSRVVRSAFDHRCIRHQKNPFQFRDRG